MTTFNLDKIVSPFHGNDEMIQVFVLWRIRTANRILLRLDTL